MCPLRNIRISAKLTLITVATSAAAILCVLIAFFVQDLRVVKRVKSEQVETQLSMLGSNLAYALTQSDLNTVSTLLKNATSEHGIVYASVNDLDGAKVSSFTLGTHAQGQDESWFPYSVTSRQHPIVWNHKTIAHLNVEVSFADVEMRTLYMMGYSAMAFFLSLGLAGVLAWIIQRQVSRPLLKLHKLSQEVFETGNYSLRANVSSRDELGQLGDAINRMLTQIENRDSMMEKRVNQRTRELQKLAEDFRYRALHDSLTGLPNRAFLSEEFNRAVAHAKRVGKNFAVLMLDLDNFKEINDSCGHQAGDELLKVVANRVRSALRGGDILCRLGGDEFIALLEGVQSVELIEGVVDTCVFRCLSEPVKLVGRQFEVGVSVGASMYPQHGEDLSDLKRSADIAMYRAKEAGKNRLAIYDPIADRQSINRQGIQNDLEQMRTKDELIIEFQPQIDTQKRMLVGCEAFVRWNHPKHGLMLPGEFIQFAEDTSAIKKIDYFVIKEACQQSQLWHSTLGVRVPVSVNLSNFHFRSNDLVAEVRDILALTQLPPAMLTLELSESALMNKSSMVDSVVDSLRNMDVKVALDGFAGYCSLSNMSSLNVDIIKFKQSLFSLVNEGSLQRRLIKGLLAFTHQLKVRIVVDGVEQKSQIPLLRKLGCPVIQGYAYSKPLGKVPFQQWLAGFSGVRERRDTVKAKSKRLVADLDEA